MRVLYDYQAFMQRHGGVSRYFTELIGALERIRGFEAWVPPLFSDNEYFTDTKTLLTRRHFKGKERLMSAVNRARGSRAFVRPFDVFHPTYYHPYFLQRLQRPFVLTVHDMIHELFSENGIHDDGTCRNKSRLCDKAARIIAVSCNTKNDLCRLLGVQESKVTVIPHATSLRYDGEPRLHDRPYILSVGARSGYKNFEVFVRAAGMVLPRYGVELVCVGGGPFTHDERDAISKSGLAGKVRCIRTATSRQLSSLYHFASAFCCPSLYEGFGMTVLEAFACGCPVTASGTSSLPEVAGNAAEYSDPRSAESIAEGIDRILSDSEYAAALVRKGTERVRAFSWERAAEQTLKVYQNAA